MKKSLLIGTTIIFSLAACENLKDYDDDIVFKVENGVEYKYKDVELYDSSTHTFYFKTTHPEFKTENDLSFEVLANGEEIYEGLFFPAYSSSMPNGPYIYCTPYFYKSFALRIEFVSPGNKTDSRNDPRIISSLKEYDLLHSGLSVLINSPVINGSQIALTFTVTNHDQSDLLIIDPDKTGKNLFHYFTNGLIIQKLTNEEVFSSNIQVAAPVPWDSWSMDWLSELKSGESRQFTINYSPASPIVPGQYIARFSFPGLSYQVTREQLYQGARRIWLGDIIATRTISVK